MIRIKGIILEVFYNINENKIGDGNKIIEKIKKNVVYKLWSICRLISVTYPLGSNILQYTIHLDE